MKIFSGAAAIWVLIGGLTGCADRRRAAFPPPPAIASSSAVAGSPAEGVRVSLSWSAPVDLDLYVTDPALETVYFAHPRSESGGRLEQDLTCETMPQGAREQTEITQWTKAPSGRYRVGIDFMDGCKTEIEEAEFRVVAEVLGSRQVKAGTVLKNRFQTVVLEFDVPAGSGETVAVPHNRRGP